jgi:hypothetical protein
MLDWLVNVLPWWAQAMILAGVIGVPLLLLSMMIFGVNATLRYAAGPVAGIIGLLAFASKLRQDGYNSRRDQEKAAREKAEKYVDDKRFEVDTLPDDQLNDRFNRWGPK